MLTACRLHKAWMPLRLSRHPNKPVLFIHESKTIITDTESQSIKVSRVSDTDFQLLCRDDRLNEASRVLKFPLDSNTYAHLLHACANAKSLQEGKQLHARLLIAGNELNVMLSTKLVSMYAMCGCFMDARLLFDRIQKPHLFLWNAMITGYVLHGCHEEGLMLYHQMQKLGVQSSNYTFPFVLKACAAMEILDLGKSTHACVIECGFESDIFVGNALVAMYGKCCSIVDARKMFDKMSQRDVVSWNSIIGGSVQNGSFEDALELLSRLHVTSVKPNSVTLASVLPACTNLKSLQLGKQIHSYSVKSGLDSNVFVGSALIDMFAKCGSAEDSRQVFDKMLNRNVVSWNAMLAGHTQGGQASETLKLFSQMQVENLKPNAVTIVSVLSACAYLAAVQQGKEVHGYIVRNGYESEVPVGSSLIDMYGKCGDIELSRNVFDKMSQKDVASWTAMIAGYGMHGYSEDAFSVFNEMQKSGAIPNHVTFIAVLSACSHAGLVDKGRRFFHLMISDYQITPSMEHYACMVDLLGRAGYLDEAFSFIKNMPVEPHTDVWGALLGACRIHCNINLGEYAAYHLFKLEPDNAGNYILLSNIYADAGMWDAAANVRIMMTDRDLKKGPGRSWIEVKNDDREFIVGDRLCSHS